MPLLAAMRRPSGEGDGPRAAFELVGHLREAASIREDRPDVPASAAVRLKDDPLALRHEARTRSRAASSVRWRTFVPSACARKMSSCTDPCESKTTSFPSGDVSADAMALEVWMSSTGWPRRLAARRVHREPLEGVRELRGDVCDPPARRARGRIRPPRAPAACGVPGRRGSCPSSRRSGPATGSSSRRGLRESRESARPRTRPDSSRRPRPASRPRASRRRRARGTESSRRRAGSRSAGAPSTRCAAHGARRRAERRRRQRASEFSRWRRPRPRARSSYSGCRASSRTPC